MAREVCSAAAGVVSSATGADVADVADVAEAAAPAVDGFAAGFLVATAAAFVFGAAGGPKTRSEHE